MMKHIYPLEWFDSLLSTTLNPVITDLSLLSKEDTVIIINQAEKESRCIQNRMKKEIFALRKKRDIYHQVRKYHSALVYFLDSIIEKLKNGLFELQPMLGLLEFIKDKLEEMLAFVEDRFAEYLSLDERVPITYLMLSKNEIQYKLTQLSGKVYEGYTGAVLEIVREHIGQFLKTFSKHKITYRQLLYQKELLIKLSSVENDSNSLFYTAIDKVLVEMNFNSQKYIELLTEHLKKETNGDESLSYCIAKLLFYKKEFDHLNSNEKLAFDPGRHHIRTVMDNWFDQELFYLEKKLELEIKTGSDPFDCSGNTANLKEKILCDLSVDQIALVLRATDEARIVQSKSMNHFFKLIVPHLSTPYKSELSYQSVRSKSYNPEDRDKEITIEILEKIIKKIKSY